MGGLFAKLKSADSVAKQKITITIVMFLSLAVVIPLSINIIILKCNWLHKDWLNVHLIPHSHDDVGWLRTPESYYDTCVKYILNNVIEELQKNSLRKFVYVETYFFFKWWQHQTEVVREKVKKLIKNKQLEMIGGGYCMSDEAVTHYQSFIDQSTWGFRLLNDTFGHITCPTVAWQIDTFGHSKGIASLLAQMGFDSFFFARLDVQDRKRRRVKKSMEFVWWGNDNLGESSSIFTSIFYDHYSAPKGFDFESQRRDAKIDFPGFAVYVREQSKAYRTNNVLIPMGDDFRYQNAKRYFEKMDELVEYFNNHSSFKLNVFYSTPSVYIDYLKKDNLVWPDKHGDFFPYAAEMYAYWTGFFTSRPTLKYFERLSNNFLQISKQLLVLANKGIVFFDELTTLREAVGIVQHHDAITGTAQQHVTDHYVELMYDGIQNCAGPVNFALGNLSSNTGNFRGRIYRSCLLLNISSCDITEKYGKFVVTVYNPLSRYVDHYVRVPVTRKSYTVFAGNGTELTSQLVAIPNPVRNIPGRKSRAKAELVFKASNVPPMGFRSFYVTEGISLNGIKKTRKKVNKVNLKAIFDTRTQLLTGFKTSTDNISMTQTIKFYKSLRNWSGAYLFGPVSGSAFNVGDRVSTKLLNSGFLVKEYEQVFSPWASQIVRVYPDEDFAEFEWLIGPIPLDETGKEVVLVYKSNILSGDVYYTDVNGMEMEKRIRNFKDWSGKTIKSVSGNYYPVTTMISIRDKSKQMYLVVDRPQGGASLNSGEIELMVHRRLCYDDGRGVTEPLNERAFGVGLIVRGRHWLVFGKKGTKTYQKAKFLSQMRHSEPWLFFFDATSLSFDEWRSQYVTEFSGLFNYVPRNVRILTLEPWREDTVLLRLEHIFEKLPVPSLSNEPVTVCLRDLFKTFEIVEARETALGADRWLSDVKRLKWRSAVRIPRVEKNHFEDVGITDNLTVSLRPQQIRTFIVKVKPRFSIFSSTFQDETDQQFNNGHLSGSDLVISKNIACVISEKLEDCIYCGKAFPHKLLIKHKAEEEKQLKCQYCEKNFENVHSFRRHMYRYHKFYSCKTCKLSFLKGPYEYHMSSVHKKKAECKICNKTFATKLSLIAHEKKIHFGQRDKKFKCGVCEYKASDKFQIDVHMARHNKTPSLVCDQCGSGHYTKTELKKHIQADHCGGYPCQICHKTFRSSEYLKRHKMIHMPDYDLSKVNFTCEECGKDFFNNISFKRHSLRHKGNLLTYSCETCGKTLTTKASFETHLRMHSGLKPFYCNKCGKAFSDKRYMNEHKHQHSDGKTFNCDVCGKKYSHCGLLNEHKKIHFDKRESV